LIEAGEGEAEGFEMSEQALVGHARHDDQHGTDPITRDAAGFDEPEQAEDEDLYGEPDTEEVEDS
jgi:hypothetical protein